MLEMQEIQFGGHEGPGTISTAWPPRFLEGPDGVELFAGQEVVAKTIGARLWRFELGEELYRLWGFSSLRWGWQYAMRILQGESVQTALSPRYIILAGDVIPSYYPDFGLSSLYVAEPLFEFPAERLAGITAALYVSALPALPSLS